MWGVGRTGNQTFIRSDLLRTEWITNHLQQLAKTLTVNPNRDQNCGRVPARALPMENAPPNAGFGRGSIEDCGRFQCFAFVYNLNFAYNLSFFSIGLDRF